MNELVEYAPCVFCGYNGAGFYQAGTHAKDCPWYTVGGGEERSVMLRKVVASLFKERRHSSHNKASAPCVHEWESGMFSYVCKKCGLIDDA